MDEKALKKSDRRLRSIAQAITEIENSQSYEVFEHNWFIILHAAKGVYTALEQGARTTPQARQWFGNKNQERKDDELIRYMIESRNDDEHGLEDTTEYVPGVTQFGVKAPGHSSVMVDQFGNKFIDCAIAIGIEGDSPKAGPKLKALDGLPIKNVFQPPMVKLVAVQDRSKKVYQPPTTHLGKNIEDRSPLGVARLTLSYLELLVAEARSFHKP